MIKCFSKLKLGDFLSLIRIIYKKATVQIIFDDPLRLRMRQYLLLAILFSFLLEVLASTMRQEKEMKNKD